MMTKYILYILLFYTSAIFAQKCEIFISDIHDASAELFSLQGEKQNQLSTIPLVDGKYEFSLSEFQPGFYSLRFNQNKSLTFINVGNEVELKTSIEDIYGDLEVIKSESNKIYYQFLELNKNYKTKTDLLNLILARYPEDDPYYVTTKKRLLELQNEYTSFIWEVIKKDSESFIARYIRSAQLPVIDISIPPQEHLNYLRKNGLNNVDFYDDGLIYSDLFTNKSIEYLTYYQNNQLPKPLLEKEFMKAVDTLLNKAKVNEIVYTHITEYLIDGFQKFGFDEVIDYILNNYVIKDDLCIDEKLESSIQQRIDHAKNIKIGSTAPNIILPDENGKLFDLSKLNKKSLLVFYSSECPHCQTMLPEIYKLYRQQKENDFEVVAISLDENKEDWLNFIETNQFDWINVSDGKGWSGKAANDYFIYATPTMFLVDMNRKIIEKPMEIAEVKSWF